MYGSGTDNVGALVVTGFLHPGAMGASLAAACGGRRLWAGSGRSPATAERAGRAGLTDVGSLAALVEQCDVIVSVCPPSAALDVADSVAAIGFDGIYVDANAVAPATARTIGSRFARFVDGGVVGPPVDTPGTTRLYLAGDEAADVAELWARSALDTRVIGGPPGAASAVKMCYAAWTKGSAALLLDVRALAGAEDVDDEVTAEWDQSIPGLTARSDAAATANAPKAWRFTGEMDEIAATFAAQDLPDGFFVAASDVYARLAVFKDAAPLPTDVVAALRRAQAAARSFSGAPARVETGMTSPEGKRNRERRDEEHEPAPDEVEQIDPDAPARSVFEEDEEAVEPNEPA